MAVPTYQELMRPLLDLLSSGETKTLRSVVDELAARLSLTDEEYESRLASGIRRFYGNVSWAITYLAGAGAVERPSRGHVRITEFGRRVLAEHPEVSIAVLRNYPEFESWYQEVLAGRGAHTETSSSKVNESPGQDEAPPEERIADAEAEHRAAVESEVLVRARALDPSQFEVLVLRLLEKMGYGRAGSVEHSGGSSDGGFDGIISQDPLGLDRIYMQAKRYAPENAVQRPEVQAFVGALAGARGDRGVFITTSRFSENALTEAQRGTARIELIDGSRLASLMVKYGIGVQVESEVRLYQPDDDFFETL